MSVCRCLQAQLQQRQRQVEKQERVIKEQRVEIAKLTVRCRSVAAMQAAHAACACAPMCAQPPETAGCHTWHNGCAVPVCLLAWNLPQCCWSPCCATATPPRHLPSPLLQAQVIEKDEQIVKLRDSKAELLVHQRQKRRLLGNPQAPLGGAAPNAKKSRAGGGKAAGGEAENASPDSEQKSRQQAQRLREMNSL